MVFYRGSPGFLGFIQGIGIPLGIEDPVVDEVGIASNPVGQPTQGLVGERLILTPSIEGVFRNVDQVIGLVLVGEVERHAIRLARGGRVEVVRKDGKSIAEGGYGFESAKEFASVQRGPIPERGGTHRSGEQGRPGGVMNIDALGIATLVIDP